MVAKVVVVFAAFKIIEADEFRREIPKAVCSNNDHNYANILHMRIISLLQNKKKKTGFISDRRLLITSCSKIQPGTRVFKA